MFRQLIGPDKGADVAQLSVRALLLFAIGIVLIRIAGRRTFSQASPLDIIVYLVVGSNVSRVMTGGAAFWPALSATLVLVLLHRAFAMATLRWDWLARWIKCEPTVLVANGAKDRAAMRRHGISDADLAEGLRLEQVADLKDVRRATLESGGRISVVPRESG